MISRGRPRRREYRVELTKGEEMDPYHEAFPAKIVELLGRTGMSGEVVQIRCKILAGRDKGKVLRRNVTGPVRKDDILMLKETVMEATPLR